MHIRQAAGMVALVFSLGTAGCARINTQLVDKPRVDQELPGNRGYLQGSGPAPAERRATRKMVQTDVELPLLDEMNPWRKKTQAAPVAAAPVESKTWEEPAEYSEPEPEPEAMPRVESTEYTVQSGDTLEKISKKFYGTTKKWRRIYDANRGVLREPNRVYPGQKLEIPMDEESAAGQDFK